jgi:SAM-dependent methyltransferase
MDPQQARTAETFDQYKDTYSNAVDKAVAFTGLKTDFFTRVKADYLIETVEARFGSADGLDALDVGCGVGNYHPLVAPRFRSLAGVDVSAACIETARLRNPGVRYDVYAGERLPYEDRSFDVAFTICVMHHVPPSQWTTFASEMHRVLRPGGIAMVFEHNPRNPLTLRAVNNCPFDEDAVLMDRTTTTAVFRLSGFQKLSARYLISVPPFNSLMRKIDGLFSPLALGAQYLVVAQK